MAVLGAIIGYLGQEREELTLTKQPPTNKQQKQANIRDITLISQRAYGLSSIMKSSVLTAVLLRDGTAQSKALELRKVAFVLCLSPGAQTPFMYCGGRATQLRGNVKKSNQIILKALSPPFGQASPHLQSGCMAAEVGRVDEAKAEDSNAATVEGSDVAQSTVLQIC